MGSLVEKYQEQFNECIRLRDLALHKSLHTQERIDYEKYNAKAFLLIDVIEDFRKLESQPRIELNTFMEEHPEFKVNSVSIINTEEGVPMDEDSFFRT